MEEMKVNPDCMDMEKNIDLVRTTLIKMGEVLEEGKYDFVANAAAVDE